MRRGSCSWRPYPDGGAAVEWFDDDIVVEPESARGLLLTQILTTEGFAHLAVGVAGTAVTEMKLVDRDRLEGAAISTSVRAFVTCSGSMYAKLALHRADGTLIAQRSFGRFGFHQLDQG